MYFLWNHWFDINVMKRSQHLVIIYSPMVMSLLWPKYFTWKASDSNSDSMLFQSCFKSCGVNTARVLFCLFAGIDFATFFSKVFFTYSFSTSVFLLPRAFLVFLTLLVLISSSKATVFVVLFLNSISTSHSLMTSTFNGQYSNGWGSSSEWFAFFSNDALVSKRRL